MGIEFNGQAAEVQAPSSTAPSSETRDERIGEQPDTYFDAIPCNEKHLSRLVRRHH